MRVLWSEQKGGHVSKIGVIFYNFPGFTLESFFAWCQRTGAGWVEILLPTIEKAGGLEQGTELVASLCEKHGVRISQVSACNDFLQKTRDEVSAQAALVGKAARTARLLGADLVRIDGGWEKPGVERKDYRELVLTGFSLALEYAEKENVRLAFDNHGVVTNDHYFQLEILGKLRTPRLGLNLDTMNYRWFGYPVEELRTVFRTMAPFVFHTHMKDGRVVEQPEKRYAGAALGEGEVPLDVAISALKSCGYHGVWCAEYEGPEKENAVGYEKCVRWLKERI